MVDDVDALEKLRLEDFDVDALDTAEEPKVKGVEFADAPKPKPAPNGLGLMDGGYKKSELHPRDVPDYQPLSILRRWLQQHRAVADL